MKRTAAKLKLSRETVRMLDAADLTQAHGQAPTTFVWCQTASCFTCNTCVVSCGGTCEPNQCWPTGTLYC